MAAARDRRCKQQGKCAAADALWGVSLGRSLALVRCANPPALQGASSPASSSAQPAAAPLYAGARAQRLQRR